MQGTGTQSALMVLNSTANGYRDTRLYTSMRITTGQVSAENHESPSRNGSVLRFIDDQGDTLHEASLGGSGQLTRSLHLNTENASADAIEIYTITHASIFWTCWTCWTCFSCL